MKYRGGIVLKSPLQQQPTNFGTDGRIFTRAECLNLERSLDHEWLETNGRGGYAASTILDCHTRKYHGLLVLPVQGLASKHVLLSKLDTSIVIKSKEFQLATNKYPGVFHPVGHQYIHEVVMGPHHTTTWRLGDTLLHRSVMMLHGQDVVLIRYHLESSEKRVTLKIRPLLAFRDYHHLSRSNMHIQVKMYNLNTKETKIEPYSGMPPLYLKASGAFQSFPGPDWMYNIEHLEERFRGFDYQEDLFTPGIIEKKLEPGQHMTLAASIAPFRSSPEKAWQQELGRRQAVRAAYSKEPSILAQLKVRAEDFLVSDDTGNHAIIAGYPWFTQWGRDAMIALPGLTFCTGRHEAGYKVLATYASYEKDGLIPNILPGGPGLPPAYNSIDACLWYCWAVQMYLKYGGAPKKVSSALWVPFQNIVNALINGTNPWAKLSDNGLINAGSAHTQLTWMDAEVAGVPVTPRHGLAVEINALWLNALDAYIKLAKQLGKKKPKGISDLLSKASDGFVKSFWLEDGQYLADVVNKEETDTSVRPNQIFAVSLPYSPLNTAQKKGVVSRVKDELVTPMGLRTLSPKNPAYKGEYRGSGPERDGAYHQGTAWAWLTGHYVEACLNTAKDKKSEAKLLQQTFQKLFQEHFFEFGLGGISEIADGNPPFKPRGCFSQAWSVAEVIRAQELLKEHAS